MQSMLIIVTPQGVNKCSHCWLESFHKELTKRGFWGVVVFVFRRGIFGGRGGKGVGGLLSIDL